MYIFGPKAGRKEASKQAREKKKKKTEPCTALKRGGRGARPKLRRVQATVVDRQSKSTQFRRKTAQDKKKNRSRPDSCARIMITALPFRSFNPLPLLHTHPQAPPRQSAPVSHITGTHAFVHKSTRYSPVFATSSPPERCASALPRCLHYGKK